MPRNRSRAFGGSGTETPIETHRTQRSRRLPLLLALVLASLGGVHSSAAAQPSPWNARVLWWHDGRIYLAAGDSTTIPGTRLTFVVRGRTIATGQIQRVVDGELVVARLESGSLAREKKPERIRVLAEPPAFQTPRLLRVGYPAAGRGAALFTCAPTTLGPPPGVRTAPGAGARGWRWIRDDSTAAAPPHWPDTVIVRLFDESADQEIALERGEIDAAVFWPGEMSTHLREHALGRQALRAAAEGVVWASGLAAGDSAALASLGRDLFRGDLLARPWTAPPSSQAARFEVDPAWPGRPALERFLARTGSGARPVRLSFGPAESLVPAGSVVVFEMRCVVVATPAVQRVVSALAPALLRPLQCAGGGGR